MSGALRTEIMKKLFELEKTPARSVEVQIWHIDRLIFYAAARLLGELAVPFYSRFRPSKSRLAQVAIPGDLCGPAAGTFCANPTNKVEALIRPSLWVPANGKSTARGVKEKISMEIRSWPIAVRGRKSCTRERAAFGSGRC